MEATHAKDNPTAHIEPLLGDLENELAYVDRQSEKIRSKGGEDAKYEYTRWITYYVNKSKRNKDWYYRLTYSVASLSAVIAVISSISAVAEGASLFDVAIITISSISAVLSVIASTTHPQENWIRLRKCAMRIEMEANKLIDGVGDYSAEKCEGFSTEDYCSVFKENLCKIVQKETNKWIKLMSVK